MTVSATIYRVNQEQIDLLERGGSIAKVIDISTPEDRFELGTAWEAFDTIIHLENYQWLKEEQVYLLNADNFDLWFNIFGRQLTTIPYFCEHAKYESISDREYASYWQEHHEELAKLISRAFFFMQDFWNEPLGIAVVLK